jgi:hypothetical protein
MSKPRDPQLEQFWRDAIVAWSRSGLSVRQYCLQQRLAEASFHGWRRQIAERDKCRMSAPKFVPVQLGAESQIEVGLPNGGVARP